MKPFISPDIADVYRLARREDMAIALYRLPGAKRMHYVSGHTTHKLKGDERAFAFAAFDPSQKPYFIIPRSNGKSPKRAAIPKVPEREGSKEKDKANDFPSGATEKSLAKLKSTSKKQYTSLVNNIVASISLRTFKKVVAARLLAIPLPGDFDELYFLEKVCAAYPHAFVSLTYIPGVGLWIGASPEVLVSQHGNELITYSLAGTKTVSDKTDWSNKEKEEQQIVTDFIKKKLEKITADSIYITKPISHNAGSLKHLLTTFVVTASRADLWQKVIKALHPTPAVSGLPTRHSVAYLKKNENFDRRFYAGYLGPVNDNGKTNIFVNLRCMELTKKQILFYAGCGVTQGSDPGREWLESERKIDILKKLL